MPGNAPITLLLLDTYIRLPAGLCTANLEFRTRVLVRLLVVSIGVWVLTLEEVPKINTLGTPRLNIYTNGEMHETGGLHGGACTRMRLNEGCYYSRLEGKTRLLVMHEPGPVSGGCPACQCASMQPVFRAGQSRVPFEAVRAHPLAHVPGFSDSNAGPAAPPPARPRPAGKMPARALRCACLAPSMTCNTPQWHYNVCRWPGFLRTKKRCSTLIFPEAPLARMQRSWT